MRQGRERGCERELSGLPGFTAFSERELRLFGGGDLWTAFAGKSVLGRRGQCLTLVGAGLVEASFGPDAWAYIGPGLTIGESSLFFPDSLERAHAVVPTTLLTLSDELALRLLEDIPALATRVLRSLASKLRSADVITVPADVPDVWI